MANEITYTFSIFLRNDNLTDNYSSGSLAADQSAAVLVRNVQNIGTGVGGTALNLGSVSTPGWSVFINMDKDNFVEIGSVDGGTFYPFLKLLPGEAHLGRLAIAAPYARADTATLDLFYIIYET